MLKSQFTLAITNVPGVTDSSTIWMLLDERYFMNMSRSHCFSAAHTISQFRVSRQRGNVKAVLLELFHCLISQQTAQSQLASSQIHPTVESPHRC